MKLKNLLLGGLCLALSWQVQAQTAPAKLAAAKPAASKPAARAAAKPAAAPAADGTLTLGAGGGEGGAKSNAILSFRELEACLNQETSIRTRLADLQAQRVPLDQDKAAITAEQDVVRAARAPLDEMTKKAENLAGRLRDYAARVEAWNTRVTQFNASGRTGAAADRESAQIKRERDALEADKKQLDTERETLTAENQTAVNAYNTRITAMDGRVTEWNTRNGQWNENSKALEADRQAWIEQCGNRRYREADEKAIRSGK